MSNYQRLPNYPEIFKIKYIGWSEEEKMYCYVINHDVPHVPAVHQVYFHGDIMKWLFENCSHKYFMGNNFKGHKTFPQINLYNHKLKNTFILVQDTNEMKKFEKHFVK